MRHGYLLSTTYCRLPTGTTYWDYSKKQGTTGFNEYATKQMRAAGLLFQKKDLNCDREPGKFVPSPPQKVIEYLIHPEISIDRFLIIHRTGLGKTFAMILGLNNYFKDLRIFLF